MGKFPNLVITRVLDERYRIVLARAQKTNSLYIADHGDKETVVPGPKTALSIERLHEALSYDAETGRFWWKIDLGNMHLKGTEAGCPKTTGSINNYRYIRLDNVEMQAARIAWAMHYGDWPASRLRYIDRDTFNLRISNLKLQNSLAGKYDLKDPVQNAAYMKAHREAYPVAWRETHLRSKFGMSLATYVAMATEQDNKCAICRCEETATRLGKVKALQVDHDHKTGKVRGLLCSDCNTGIGKMKENRDALVGAIKYLDKHSGNEVVKPTLTVVDGET